jgi:hypothetical protein
VREQGGVEFVVNWILRDSNEGGDTGCTVDERASWGGKEGLSRARQAVCRDGISF